MVGQGGTGHIDDIVFHGHTVNGIAIAGSEGEIARAFDIGIKRIFSRIKVKNTV